jgi:formylglycine-generating enzyme required for sulfatase activity
MLLAQVAACASPPMPAVAPASPTRPLATATTALLPPTPPPTDPTAPVAPTAAPPPTAAPAGAAGMVRFAPGSFTMGRDDGPADERAAHTVHLEGFELDVLAVTNEQFATFLEAYGPTGPGGQTLFDAGDADARVRRVEGRWRADAGAEEHPVYEANWPGARAYCLWRGARLPTEAEWERAARGTEGRPYPWGSAAPAPSRARFAAGWTASLPVGALPAGATPEGLLGMAGNEWEWTSSLYRPYPYRADDGREDPGAHEERVTRGGGQDSPSDHLRTTYRGRGLSRAPAAGHHNIGFRCAR